jgi:hypothetical protein
MKTLRRLNGITAAFAAGALLFAADGALAHSGDHDHGQNQSDSSQMKSHDSKSDHSDMRSDKYKDMKSGDMRSDKHKDKDSKHAEKMKEKEAKRAEKMKEKEEKHAEKTKDKDKDKSGTTATSASPPAPGTGGTNNIHPIMSPPPAPGAASPATPVTVIGGGLVRDKLPDGTVYARRGTSAELAAAGPSNGGSSTAGTSTAGNSPPSSNPTPGSALPHEDPVVRDHRPGGNAAAYPAPGTIIRDHTNGADGKPVVVVSAGRAGIVTRPATDADFQRPGVISDPGILSGINNAIGDTVDSIGHGIAGVAGHLDPVPGFTAHAPANQ